MIKELDWRPRMTVLFGAALILCCTATLGLRFADTGVGLILAVARQHRLEGRVWDPLGYLGKCAFNPVCVGAYFDEGWRQASPLERSTLALLAVGGCFAIVGASWNPSLAASRRVRARALDQNSLPARASAKPGWWPWA